MPPALRHTARTHLTPWIWRARFERLRWRHPNKRLIRFLGLRRSGNHAVINWLFSQLDGPALWANAIPVHGPMTARRDNYRWRDGRGPGWLLASYEEQPLDAVRASLHDGLGRVAGPPLTVLVLRDPFNTLASRKHKTRNRLSPSAQMDDLRRTLVRWTWYAHAAATALADGDTALLPISYNRWFTDVTYRDHIAATVGVDRRSDDALEAVLPFGGGSSFDRRTYDGAAQRMDVLERWRHYVDDPGFRKLLGDPALHRLSAEVVGHVAGVEVLRNDAPPAASATSSRARPPETPP